MLSIYGGVERRVVVDEFIDDWLSSLDDGNGEVQDVHEISENDSSDDVEDNELDRGIGSKLFDNVKLVIEGNEAVVGSCEY